MSIQFLYLLLGLVLANTLDINALSQDAPAPSTVFNPPSQEVFHGRLKKMVNPVYPDVAKLEHVDGTVILHITIGVDGTVKVDKVTHGLPQLIPAAVHAVSQWVYEPYRVNGVATPIATTITVNFGFAPPPADAVDDVSHATASGTVAPPRAVVLPPAPPGVLRVSGRVMTGMLNTRVDPVYPADAVALDARGTVVLLVVIGKDGQVGDVQAVSGPTRFRDVAIAAVKQWHYRPYLLDGEAAQVQTTITLNFSPPK